MVPRDDDLLQVSILQEYIGWSYNAVVTGLYLKLDADIWEATLKVEMASGPKYAQFTNTSLIALVETVHWYASKGYVSWRRDKHPVRVSKRRGVYRRRHSS